MNRDDIFNEAVRNCFRELYRKSQPSADYDEIVEKVKNGEIVDTNENPVYNRYYLSMEEFTYIRDKYLEAYKMKNTWNPNIDLLKSYFVEGGTKDKYIPEHIDEDGFEHPGYRGYEKVLPFKEQIFNYLKYNGIDEELSSKLAEGIDQLANDNIQNCKDFYNFDREESDFNWAVTLGASPTSNKEKVIEYWKKQGIDVEIKDRNPLLLWEMDNYGEEYADILEEEYGENWEEIWWQKYEEKKREEAIEREERLKQLSKNYDNN